MELRRKAPQPARALGGGELVGAVPGQALTRFAAGEAGLAGGEGLQRVSGGQRVPGFGGNGVAVHGRTITEAA